MFDFIGIIALVALFVIVSRLQGRVGKAERELEALRRRVAELAGPAGEPAAASPIEAAQAPAASGEQPASVPDAEATDTAEGAPSPEPGSGEERIGPWSRPAAAAMAGDADRIQQEPGAPVQKPDIETALGTRWAVWVGGLALALGGVFLIRYSIEAGIFGPGARLTMAALLGLVLAACGEFLRRNGYAVPVRGISGAYIPGILTAAGALVLFGTVYAAHGLYGFIGPGTAFVLMGAIGLATIGAALVHGQALAGIGLVGAMATPALVSSQSPNVWVLFGYLAIVLAAAIVIARTRDWRPLASGAFLGSGLWMLAYLGSGSVLDLGAVLFLAGAMLAALGLAWLSRRDGGSPGIDWPTVIPAFFLALTALGLLVAPTLVRAGGTWPGTTIIAAMIAVALWRSAGIALVHAAGAAIVLAFLRLLPPAEFGFGPGWAWIDLGAVAQADILLRRVAPVPALLMLASGLWSARRLVARSPILSASWAGWAAAVPLVILFTVWLAFGNPDRDYVQAALAALLMAVLACGAEWISRAEEPRLAGGTAVGLALAGSGLAALVMIHAAFGSGLTTVLVGAAAAIPALATRWRSWPALGWLSVAAVVAVMGRIALDPTIVGAASLRTTPVFNWLLAGYGVPALAFAFAAWQLARTTGGRPRLAMEAGAALFSLLTLAMLVRHAMHGGVIDDGAPTLAEQAIYTLIALGAGAILIALDMRSPSSVLRWGSIGVGVLSVLFIAGQHFLLLNPLFTDESTGGIPVFNLLFLGYLLPGIAALALAWYAREKRPRWYSSVLALVGSLLFFAYATLSVRRLFQGEFIGLWKGLDQLETYSYSALWLVIGVALLTGGVLWKSQVLRIASAALIAVAVLKVFLVDMSELEGVLRALSFIGLGAVLIGIGLFYQRLLTRAARG